MTHLSPRRNALYHCRVAVMRDAYIEWLPESLHSTIKADWPPLSKQDIAAADDDTSRLGTCAETL